MDLLGASSFKNSSTGKQRILMTRIQIMMQSDTSNDIFALILTLAMSFCNGFSQSLNSEIVTKIFASIIEAMNALLVDALLLNRCVRV